MTENKPIIIDEVDVSGCEDYGYRGRAGYWCHNYDEPCTDYPNCYYKQLARKTQECEELKRKSEEQSWRYAELDADLEQLKAENEKYKKKFQEFFNIDNQECWNAAFLQDEKAKAEQKLKFVENVLFINYQLWMYYIANGINNSSNHTILDLIEDFATSIRLLANTLDIQDNTLNYYTKDSIVYNKKNKELQKLNNEVRNAKND